MKIAVMQPYLFPYLGYYQLLKHVDVFVLYDDVTYIKGGYINRNFILSDGKPARFTVPVLKASSNRLIKDIEFSSDVDKLLRTLRQNYAKAPHVSDVFPLVENVLTNPIRDIPTICRRSLADIMEYLGEAVDLRNASGITYDRSKSAPDKLLSICAECGAQYYVNSIGGQEIYSKEYFAKRDVGLSFLKMKEVAYNQGSDQFVPNLSIIDLLMWCDKETIRNQLEAYAVV
jgi:hypothetical protein